MVLCPGAGPATQEARTGTNFNVMSTVPGTRRGPIRP